MSILCAVMIGYTACVTIALLFMVCAVDRQRIKAIRAQERVAVHKQAAIEWHRLAYQAEFRETIATNLLARRRKREAGTPQARNARGQFQ